MARTPAKYYYDRTWMERARLAKGFTESHMARVADTSASNYHRVEKGLQTPDVRRGLAICRELDLKPEMFLTEKKIPLR